MISRKSTEDPRQLRPHIQKLLNEWCRKHRLSFTLKVSEEVVQQDEWTYYIVVPNKGHVRAYEYAEALAAIEAGIRRDEHVENVLLVPTLPG